MDKRESNYQQTQGSASKAVDRVRRDPDNSGRSVSDREENSGRRLAKAPSSGQARRQPSQGQPPQGQASPSGQARRQPSQGQASSSGQARRQPSQGQASSSGQARRQPSQGQSSSGQTRRQPPQDRPSGQRRLANRRRDEDIRSRERHYVPLEDAEDDIPAKGEIRINRKMRMWNKYKNYIFGGIAVVLVVVLLVFTLRSCAKDSQEEQENLYSKPSMGALKPTGTEPETNQQTQTQGQEQSASNTPTTAVVSESGVLTTTKTAAQEEYTSENAFAKSVFLGDAIVNGIEYYKYLPSDNVVSDTNMTAGKAADKVSEVAALNPEKVYIMLGINDLNYNSKTVDSISDDFLMLAAELRNALPNAKIYIISVTPITQSFESKSSTYVKMSNVVALNTKLKEIANNPGVFFVDINSAFVDGAGYLNSDVTSNGYNLNVGYYGFLLNTIAEMTK